MPIYSYKGLDKSGKEIKSNITTESLSIAKSKIRSQGIMLVEIKEQKSQSKKKGEPAKFSLSFGNSVPVADLALMTRQLATLIKAKIQIVEALNALVEQSENPRLQVVLAEVKQKVNEGSSLASALADYPKVFNTVYVNMVEAGEASGTLQVVLLRLADFTEAQVKLKQQIKKAMTYPIIIMSLGVAMMSIILVFVIPKISRIFISTKKELPLQTKISIWMSNFMVDYWMIIFPALIALYILFMYYIGTPKGKKVWHMVLLKTPIVGDLTMMINISRFSSSLSTLLNSGVPILTSMRIVKNLVANVHMQKAIEESRTSIAEGASITAPLIKSGLFPPMVTHMIKLGEKSGELEDMLGIVSENYSEQVETKLSGLTSFIEPIMMVFMGLAVAFIIFSVVVPIMELNNIR